MNGECRLNEWCPALMKSVCPCGTYLYRKVVPGKSLESLGPPGSGLNWHFEDPQFQEDAAKVTFLDFSIVGTHLVTMLESCALESELPVSDFIRTTLDGCVALDIHMACCVLVESLSR